jgi:uncharacterized protein YndB with AHSA1/START domain
MPELFARESIDADAPPERVWQVITTSEYTRQFMYSCDAISDWQAGSTLDWVGSTNGVVYVHGHITAIEPPSLLQYTTIDPNAPDFEDIPENYLTVTLRLTPADGGTHIDVEQGDFAKVAQGQKRYEDTGTGWKMALEGIKRLAEA